MEFKDVIPFIVLLIYILSLFKRKKKQVGKDASIQEPSPLKSIIQTIVKQLKEHAEASRKDSEQQKRQQPADEKRSMPTTTDRFNTQKEDEVSPVKKKAVVEEVLLEKPVLKINRQADMTDLSEPVPVSLQELRKAVVWSEILGSPVALRENHPRLPYDR